MKIIMAAIATACLLTGAVGGYGIGYMVYEPIVRSYEVQVSNLTSQVSMLNQTTSNQEAQILNLESERFTLESEKSELESENYDLESEKSRLQSEKSELESENSILQEDIAEAQETLTSYKGQLTTLKSQVSGLQARLGKILEVTVTQHYEWNYRGKVWKWDLAIPQSLYVEYLERPRPVLGASYVDMAKDPKDDPYIDEMIQQINIAAMGFTEFEKVNFVIAFVQSLTYTVDIETTPYDEYPRYPVETLFDRGGDCEDTSILVAALLDRMGYDVALLLLKNAKHMAVGVSIAPTYGLYYEYDGKKYYYLETTGEGWQIGQIPPDITDTRAQIYPLRN